MKITTQTNLSQKQKVQIVELWNAEYPIALMLPNVKAFDTYLNPLVNSHHLLLTDESKTLKGWLVYFIRDNEQCFAMILDASLQGQGFGIKLLNLAKKHNLELNGWVINNDKQLKRDGTFYASPLNFYLKNDFKLVPNVLLDKQEIKAIKVQWSNEV